jgi:hypothetical protein
VSTIALAKVEASRVSNSGRSWEAPSSPAEVKRRFGILGVLPRSAFPAYRGSRRIGSPGVSGFPAVPAFPAYWGIGGSGVPGGSGVHAFTAFTAAPVFPRSRSIGVSACRPEGPRKHSPGFSLGWPKKHVKPCKGGRNSCTDQFKKNITSF